MLLHRPRRAYAFRLANHVCRLSSVQGLASSLSAQFQPTPSAPLSSATTTPPPPSLNNTPILSRDEITQSLIKTLDELILNFPNHQSIHTRLQLVRATLNDPNHPLRIALVPHGPNQAPTTRHEIKALLDACLADPLASNQTWYDQYWTKRIMQKDALVGYGEFKGVATHNSRVQLTVPSKVLAPVEARDNGRSLEILEANSMTDSIGNIRHCHYTVFVSKDLRGLSNPTTTDLTDPTLAPSLMVLDLDTLNQKIDLGPDVVVLSSKRALDAVQQLRESTSHATAYTDLWTSSNIDQFIHRLSQSTSLTSLSPLLNRLVSVLRVMATDPTQVARAVSHEDLIIRNLTRDWAKHAHEERNTVLKPCLNWWATKSLPWYKLYYRIGDVRAATENMLVDSYLPGASYRLGYLLGRIDHYTTTRHPNHAMLGKEEEELLDIGITDLTSGAVSPATVIIDSRSKLISSTVTTTTTPTKTNELHTAKSLSPPIITTVGSLTQLETSARKILATAILAIQAPTFTAAVAGYFQYNLSLYSMSGVAALGFVMGLMHLQRQWGLALNKFQDQVMQQASEAISQAEGVVWNRWNSSSDREVKAAAVRSQLLDKFDGLVAKWK